jgi:hypothetical protein
MGKAFFFIDIVIAVAVLGFFAYMHFGRRFSPVVWYMFWIGVLIGATWEIGFYFLGPRFSPQPIYVFSTEPPFPSIVLHVAHCFWDGGLFMVGVAFVIRLLKPPHLMRFRWPELGMMLGWGVLQEIAVELLSIGGGMWLYQSRWFNPSLFEIGDSPFTLLPILIWVVAPVFFYLLVLPVNRRWGPIGSIAPG